MGNVSSCCAAESAKSCETIKAIPNETPKQASSKMMITDAKKSVHTLTQPKVHETNSHDNISTSDEEINSFRKRLEKSLDVTVLLADGTNLLCQLKLKPETKSLLISCEANFRDIPLSDLKAILHGKEQLRRVETKASLTDDFNLSCCTALHMVTGNCIPVRFNEKQDKEAFIELIDRLRKQL